MLEANRNESLYSEHASYISDADARSAYDFMLGAAASLPSFLCYPEQKGAVKDFRFYTTNGDQPFAFIVNRSSLLFYLRPPAVRAATFSLGDLRQQFDEVNENPAGEWTIRIRNREDALKIVQKILSAWRKRSA